MVKKIVVESIEFYDAFSWIVVIIFFMGSAYLFSGDIAKAYLGASGIIILMFLISVSIEIIIETLQETKGLGTLLGFITNGPEALCLIVGLISGNILFAASTPLGSNFMNPLLLLIAGLLSQQLVRILRTRRIYTVSTITITASLAVSFYLIDSAYYIAWNVVVFLISCFLFWKRPEESIADSAEKDIISANEVKKKTLSWIFMVPALIILVFAGYFLDTVVSFTSEHSHAPKELVGFLVLALLTSWPEFKSCMSLLKRQKVLDSILNITVSNITNLWLAVLGVTIWLLI